MNNIQKRYAAEVVRQSLTVLVLQDVGHDKLGQFMTMTNAMADVVRDYAPNLRPGQRLFYIDSMGEAAEVLLSEGLSRSFVGFRYIEHLDLEKL